MTLSYPRKMRKSHPSLTKLILHMFQKTQINKSVYKFSDLSFRWHSSANLFNPTSFQLVLDLCSVLICLGPFLRAGCGAVESVVVNQDGWEQKQRRRRHNSWPTDPHQTTTASLQLQRQEIINRNPINFQEDIQSKLGRNHK